MAESYLLRSYRGQEDREIDNLISQSKARLATQTEAGESEEGPSPAGSAPAPGLGGAQPDQAEFSLRAITDSIGRGLAAIPERIGKGISDIRGTTPTESAGARALQFAMGALNVIVPFAAFAYETGGDFHEWLSKYSGELTDANLRAARLNAEKHAPGTVSMYDSLLAVPYEERVKNAREGGGLALEIMSGVIPGWTSPASPVKPPQQSHR